MANHDPITDASLTADVERLAVSLYAVAGDSKRTEALRFLAHEAAEALADVLDAFSGDERQRILD